MGLYFDPPLVPRCRQHLTQYHRAHSRECWAGAQAVEFPQMKDVPSELIGPFPCQFCERKLPTVQALEQHQSVAHKKRLEEIKMGQILGETLAQNLGSFPAPSAQRPKMRKRKKATSKAK